MTTVMPSLAWQLERTHVEAAWAHTRGGTAVIAIIDAAFDIGHREFEGRIIKPYTVGADGEVSERSAWQPHGTECAGVACAGGGRVIGVAPEALLMPVTVESLASAIGSSREAHAIRFAVESGADVISCSWGPPGSDSSSRTLPNHTREAMARAADHGRDGKGCVIVWAAGNDDTDIALDGYTSHPNVIAVGACNDHGKRSSYSNWGDALWCVFPSNDPDDPEHVHQAISTTTPTGSFSLGETFYTDSFGFTSAACAGVAGLCALILSANPDLTWWEVKEVLRDSCVKIDHEGGTYDKNGHSPLYGYGRPDAGVAVQLALERRPSTARHASHSVPSQPD